MPPQSFVAGAPVAPVKVGKFKASRTIVRESWALLSHDRELLWMPVLSGLTFLLSVGALAALFLFAVGGNLESLKSLENAGEGVQSATIYGGIFVYYLLVFFIANFFQAGLFLIVKARLEGGNLSLGQGLSGARQHAGKIFIWSLISATVGVILQIIADRSKVIAKIVAAILGSAWNILTYFSLPALVIGQASVTDSFKESATIMKKTWGETIIVNFGVGFFFGLIMLLLIAIGATTVILLPTLSVALAVGGSFFVLVILISILSTTLSSIFKLVLYEYARTGSVPQGFSSSVVQGAISAK